LINRKLYLFLKEVENIIRTLKIPNEVSLITIKENKKIIERTKICSIINLKNIPKNDFFENIDNKIYRDLNTSNETTNNFDSKKIFQFLISI
jgi:hypothetical protein